MSSRAARASRPGWSTAARSSSRPTPTARFNTDESWVFLRGGWGELRMGDEDGVVDNSIIGGQTIAAGTGGIDGSSFVVAGISGEGVFPTETDDSTKIRYYTPSFGGFSLGVSFTPTVEDVGSGANNGQFIARKSGAVGDGSAERRRGRPGLRWRLRWRRPEGLRRRPVRQAEERRQGRSPPVASAARMMVLRGRRCRVRSVGLQARRQRRHRQGRRPRAPVRHRRHRLWHRPGEHLDHRCLHLRLERRLLDEATATTSLQHRVLGRLCAWRLAWCWPATLRTSTSIPMTTTRRHR